MKIMKEEQVVCLQEEKVCEKELDLISFLRIRLNKLFKNSYSRKNTIRIFSIDS